MPTQSFRKLRIQSPKDAIAYLCETHGLSPSVEGNGAYGKDSKNQLILAAAVFADEIWFHPDYTIPTDFILIWGC
jgi:hypothetical protein